MRQMISQDILDYPSFLSLKTAKDTTGVARQYAFIRKAIQEIANIQAAIRSGVSEERLDQLVHEIGIRLDDIGDRADLAANILLGTRKRVAGYVNDMKIGLR